MFSPNKGTYGPETNTFSTNVFIVNNKDKKKQILTSFFANFDYDQYVNLSLLLFTVIVKKIRWYWYFNELF